MSLRMERVASLIKEEVGLYFSREFRDPAYGLITITDVHVSPDLRISKIYVSIMGSAETRKETLTMLENHKRQIRSYLGSQIRLKFTPSIHFYIDDTLDRVEKIENLIKQIHKNDSSQKN